MSVTILDIMHLPSLQEARIVAGMNGINRSIASVSVLEAAAAKDLDIDLPGHATNYGQEIILTAFVAYRDSVDAQCEAIHALHQEGEAGIIIFYVGSILPSIDPRVIDLANELEMPIIVMPEGRLDLRYSDVICEIMEAIINDRRENSYFTTEVIERISHLGTSQRSINNALAIIRDRVQCSIYLMDELGRMLNMAEWPNGRNLPAGKFYTTFTNDTTLITGVQEVHIDGKTYLADIETIQSTGSILYMLVVKEKGSLTQESCKQIKYIIKTYINLWTENYGQLDTKQLVSSIINDEPEKMRHIANAIKINVDNLSCAYFFYLKDGSHEFIYLQKMREIIKDFISVYKNTFLTDIFDDTVIVFADRRRERIDDDLPNLLHELEVRGLLCCVAMSPSQVNLQSLSRTWFEMVRRSSSLQRIDIQEALKDLLGGTIKSMMEAEMDEHLGYERYERNDGDNYRNGTKSKKVRSSYGEFEIDVPQDRAGTFEPRIVKKRQKDISGIDQKIISMYARGLTTRQIVKVLDSHPEMKCTKK